VADDDGQLAVDQPNYASYKREATEVAATRSRMLRSAPPLRRGALLIRGPSAWQSGSPSLRCIVKNAAPRPGHMSCNYLPTHFGGRFSEKASAPRYNPATAAIDLTAGYFACSAMRCSSGDREVVDCLFGGADRHRAVLADGLRQRSRDERFACRHHLVDEAELVAFLGGDVPRGEDHAHGRASDRSGAAGGAIRRRAREADVRLGHATSHSEAMMRSQASAISKPPPIATPLTAAMTACRSRNAKSARRIRRRPSRAAAGRPAFQIVAGTERLIPGAGDDRDPLLRSAEKSSNILFQFEMRVDMQGVINFGRDSVTTVIGPLRVTLENFKSMFAPFLFCGEEFVAWILARSRRPIPSITQGACASQAIFHCLT